MVVWNADFAVSTRELSCPLIPQTSPGDLGLYKTTGGEMVATDVSIHSCVISGEWCCHRQHLPRPTQRQLQ